MAYSTFSCNVHTKLTFLESFIYFLFDTYFQRNFRLTCVVSSFRVENQLVHCHLCQKKKTREVTFLLLKNVNFCVLLERNLVNIQQNYYLFFDFVETYFASKSTRNWLLHEKKLAKQTWCFAHNNEKVSASNYSKLEAKLVSQSTLFPAHRAYFYFLPKKLVDQVSALLTSLGYLQ